MKTNIFGICAILLVAFGAFDANASPLLGAAECTWGPSYWCQNLSNAKNCNAVTHCIQTVWEKQNVPEDNDSICKICKDMVTQARDQLRSNETMEELKQVFEGSCNLIPIKIVKKECDKLADDFVPELVEALSSQMNPDQVCSVAGLCNNARIDEIMQRFYQGALDGTLKEEDDLSAEKAVAVPETVVEHPKVPDQTKRPLSCGNCQQIGSFITNKFTDANRDDMLENMLHLCGEMSSFSDACSSILLTYFNDIYEHLKDNLAAAGICHMSGVCSGKYHQHPEDLKAQEQEEVVDLATVGDDIPCDLCQQLVHHLRDVLVANTTEAEFKQVLQGLCNQTKGFKDECLSLADQYYDIIYQNLVKNLDANGICFLIGVCPKGAKTVSSGEIRPLLPVLPPAKIEVTIRKKLGANEPKFTQEEIHSMVLPIDHLMSAANPSMLVENGMLCTMCEYILHSLQEALSTPATEDEIKDLVNNVCSVIPSSVRGQCHNFIDMYSDAVIALLVQGLNPREVCPKMQVCPQNIDNRHDMEVFSPHTIESDESDKPTCPLCLLAVEEAQEKIKNDKSKDNIKKVLSQLCNHLPTKLSGECVDFVKTYSNELIDLLITDFKPQEICVTIKLCPKNNSYLNDLGISIEEESFGSSSSEESFDNNISNVKELPLEIVFDKHVDKESPNCWLCEEVIKQAEKKMNKHVTKDDIKKALEQSCNKMNKSVRNKCITYIERYGDKIAFMILKEMEPKVICTELGLCLWSDLEDLDIDEALKYDVIAMPNEDKSKATFVDYDFATFVPNLPLKEPSSCVLCEFVMAQLEVALKKKSTQDEIKQTVEQICKVMPNTLKQDCNTFIDKYANVIISLVGTVPPKEICLRLELCIAFDGINDEVVECGICHGATTSLWPFFRQHLDHSNISTQDMVNVGCENLPARYHESCTEMIQIYGNSLLHIYDRVDVKEKNICAEIGKCFVNEKSSLAFAKIIE